MRNPHCIRSSFPQCDLSNSLTELRSSYMAEILSEPPLGETSDLTEFPYSRSPRFCPYNDSRWFCSCLLCSPALGMSPGVLVPQPGWSVHVSPPDSVKFPGKELTTEKLVLLYVPLLSLFKNVLVARKLATSPSYFSSVFKPARRRTFLNTCIQGPHGSPAQIYSFLFFLVM